MPIKLQANYGPQTGSLQKRGASWEPSHQGWAWDTGGGEVCCLHEASGGTYYRYEAFVRFDTTNLSANTPTSLKLGLNRSTAGGETRSLPVYIDWRTFTYWPPSPTDYVSTVAGTAGTIPVGAGGTPTITLTGGLANLKIQDVGNFAIRNTYTLSPAPYSGYPDTNPVSKLTNGIKTSTAYDDGNWVGWSPLNDPIIIVDLMFPRPFTEVMVYLGTNTNRPLYVPTDVTISGSNDNTTFTTIITKTKAQLGLTDSALAGTSVSIQVADLLMPSIQTYRYIKIAMTHQTASSYTVALEIEIINNDTTKTFTVLHLYMNPSGAPIGTERVFYQSVMQSPANSPALNVGYTAFLQGSTSMALTTNGQVTAGQLLGTTIKIQLTPSARLSATTIKIQANNGIAINGPPPKLTHLVKLTSTAQIAIGGAAGLAPMKKLTASTQIALSNNVTISVRTPVQSNSSITLVPSGKLASNTLKFQGTSAITLSGAAGIAPVKKLSSTSQIAITPNSPTTKIVEFLKSTANIQLSPNAVLSVTGMNTVEDGQNFRLDPSFYAFSPL